MNKRKTRLFTLIRRLESKELQEVKKDIEGLEKTVFDLICAFETQKLHLFNSPEQNINIFNVNPYVKAMPQKISLEHRIKALEK